VVYAGFDPTASSLHMGNLLQIVHLRRLQLAGNKPILLAGGGTGLIGDPTAKAEERPLLTVEQLEHNVASVRTQLERYIDFSSGSAQATLLDNAAWLTKISLTDFLRDTGKHFTVNQMVAKDSVKSRFEREDVGISFTEFSYMLLQAYDFLHLHREHGCNIQIGGSDQWGNITMGVELVRKVAGNQVFGLTTPLLLKSDGTKFGKSEHGAVYLDPNLTSPFAMHQFLLNTEDDMVISLLNFFTFLSRGEIDELAAATESAPQERRAQRALADAVVGFVHSPEAATAASEAGRALFSEDIASLSEAMFIEVLADVPSSSVSRAELEEGIDLVDLLVRASLASSRGEARRFVEQGGIYLNNVKSQSEKVGLDSLLHDRYIVVRRGRRNTHLVKVG
jgi:tyrosyl-tRNA synthetase